MFETNGISKDNGVDIAWITGVNMQIQHKTDGLEQDYSRETYGKDQKRRKPAAKLFERSNHALLQHEGTFEEVVRPSGTQGDNDHMKLSTMVWLVFVSWALSNVVKSLTICHELL